MPRSPPAGGRRRVRWTTSGLIQALPLPTAPPTFPQKEAALGLALMDLSLRLDHVARLAEHLTPVDRGHMARSVSVDVDLDAISPHQRESLLVPGEARWGHGPSLWVPVSRYSRRDLAPVIVKDSTGEVVPRFTHRDSNRVAAAAFVRLLSMLLDAHPDVTVENTVIHKLRHTHQRSRWLSDDNIVVNHKFAISTSIRCTFPSSSRRTGASATGRVPYPLWLRWEVPHHTVHTPALLADVQANLQPYAAQCELAYAQSRLVRGGMVRGLAKLVVVLAHGHRDHTEAQRQLADVAERAEEQTLKQLLNDRHLEAGRTRLRMSPRERWLAYAGVSV